MLRPSESGMKRVESCRVAVTRLGFIHNTLESGNCVDVANRLHFRHRVTCVPVYRSSLTRTSCLTLQMQRCIESDLKSDSLK